MNLTLELSGLNLERLLRTAGENGVRLQNVRRADERTMRVTVSAAQKGKLAALCGRYGWQMTEIRADWPLRLIRTMKRRWTLGAAMLLSVFWVFVSSEMIWRVEITGAGENIAEVRRCLARENARVGRLKKRVSTDRLAAELALAVPGLSHAAARYEGSTLVVACQQAREGERAGVDGTGRDIVAARDAAGEGRSGCARRTDADCRAGADGRRQSARMPGAGRDHRPMLRQGRGARTAECDRHGGDGRDSPARHS